MVCRLKKALYGLKQSQRCWYTNIDSYLTDLGFHRSDYDKAVYKKTIGRDDIFVALYVDDLVYTSGSEALMSKFNEEIQGSGILFIFHSFSLSLASRKEAAAARAASAENSLLVLLSHFELPHQNNSL